MKTEIQELWVKALRSGEFTQAKGTLHRVTVPEVNPEENSDEFTTGYCCLGVLCDIAVKEGVITRLTSPDDVNDGSERELFGTPEEFDKGLHASAFLPKSVKNWSGLDRDDVFFDMTDTDLRNHPNISYAHQKMVANGDRIVVRASDLNDRYNYTFSQIADLIEAGKMTDVVPESVW